MNTESKRQNRLSIVTKEKYNFFLKEVYRQIQDNKYIYMHSICCDLKIGRHIPTILKQENIIKSNGVNKYIWIGKRPSSQMVNLIIEKGRIYCDKTKYSSLETKQKQIDFKTSVTKPVLKLIEKPVAKPIEKPVVKILNKTPEVKVEKTKFSVSLLWGMFKYQKD